MTDKEYAILSALRDHKGHAKIDIWRLFPPCERRKADAWLKVLTDRGFIKQRRGVRDYEYERLYYICPRGEDALYDEEHQRTSIVPVQEPSKKKRRGIFRFLKLKEE